MPSSTLRLTVILASVRAGRFGPVVAQWFTGEAERHGQFEIDLLDLAETPLPAELPASLEELVSTQTRPAPMADLAGRLGDADAFVVVTPEYNHSYPASIKNLIDWHPTEWKAKPVGFVSYGGYGGGLRAVEHLRTVFPELYAVTARNTVSFDEHWERFDAAGELVDAAGPNGAAKVLLDELLWWADLLRTARLSPRS
ncbi:MAG: NADPH-dependent FMN reductase [Actinomycetota bacterium]